MTLKSGLRVIGNGTIREIAWDSYATSYDSSLLVVHSNYDPILYHFRDKEILVENRDFFHIPPEFDWTITY